ncbi:MAG: hypothetical protein KIH69_017535 [Anaerolineae bacterium]|nr:hypothetical protein [Anaerolineae bacterium]
MKDLKANLPNLIIAAFGVGAFIFGEMFAPMQRLNTQLTRNAAPYFGITLAALIISTVWFVGAGVVALLRHGRRMTAEEVKEPLTREETLNRRYFTGSAVSQTVSMSASPSDLKAAVRSGAAWRDPQWRLLLLTMMGGALFFVSLLAFVFVIVPSAGFKMLILTLGIAAIVFILHDILRHN